MPEDVEPIPHPPVKDGEPDVHSSEVRDSALLSAPPPPWNVTVNFFVG